MAHERRTLIPGLLQGIKGRRIGAMRRLKIGSHLTDAPSGVLRCLPLDASPQRRGLPRSVRSGHEMPVRGLIQGRVLIYRYQYADPHVLVSGYGEHLGDPRIVVGEMPDDERLGLFVV